MLPNGDRVVGFKIIHLGLKRWGIIERWKRSQCESKARVDLKNKS